MTRLQSYLVDVRAAAKTHWWVPAIAVPMVGFGAVFLVYSLEKFGEAIALRFMSYYALVCLIVLGAVVLVQTAWSWVVEDDPDHLVP